MPEGDGWQYEPKWDGFRCLARKDGDDVDLRSKSGQPLGRYFPEIVAALAALPARRFVVDGELVVPLGGTLSFDDLQLRLHPAASRVRLLAERTPATLVLFDLLAEEGESLANRPLSERRRRLDAFAATIDSPRFALSPATTSALEAQEWLRRSGSGLDGIVAKRRDAAYGAGNRDAMVKYKNLRSADCVVGGFRYASGTRAVGSLLLGLYGEMGCCTMSASARGSRNATAAASPSCSRESAARLGSPAARRAARVAGIAARQPNGSPFSHVLSSKSATTMSPAADSGMGWR